MKKEKKKVYIRLLIRSFLVFQFSFLTLSCSFDRKESVKWIKPSRYFYLPSSTTGEMIHHSYYSLSYNKGHVQAEWVAWKLESWMLKKKYKRKNKFKSDSLVSISAENEDYSLSGYDKGHLCPAGDMTFEQLALEETFYFSNISPQKPSFNRGIWKKLEEQVRIWAKEKYQIYVYTGGILAKLPNKIGKNGVSVPQSFFKIIFYYNPPRISVIAFIMPNQNSEQKISKYIVSVDEVEEKTGIDFFSFLPDMQESILERSIETSEWPIHQKN